MRSYLRACGLLLTFAVTSSGNLAFSEEFTPQDLEAATRRKEEIVAAAKAGLEDLQTQLKDANKKRDFTETRRLAQEVKAAHARVLDASKTPIDAIAKTLAAERKEQRRFAQEKAAQAAAARQAEVAARQAEAAARQAAEKDEQDRLTKSGGCPLRINGLDFRNSDLDRLRGAERITGEDFDLPSDIVGEATSVKFEIENCTDKPVEAHELFVEFLDGFDTVIKNATLQGTQLEPREKRPIRNWWPRVETAVQVRVSIIRAKLPEGQIWTRKPEHERISETIKKPRGAD